MFQGGAELRRNFLDLMISSINKSYKKTLSEYKKYKSERLQILKKNYVLKNEDWLDVIERKMSEKE